MEQRPAAAGDIDPYQAIREQYLRSLLERFEAGALDAYEYSRRVRSLELAQTVPQMAAIVEAPPPNEPAYDAVDLLLMAKAASTVPEKKSGVRLFWPVLLAFFLVILLAVGLWLASHARQLHSPTTTTGIGIGQPASSSGPSVRR
ncbi:MAG: hypothetical protein ACYDA2_00350 [Acidimicrobiales bacterium]